MNTSAILPRVVRCLGALSFGLLLSLSAVAQPSGGPYGPVRQSFSVPADAARVIYVSPEGAATASGEKLDAPTTIESAIERASTGDVILLRGGVYRTGGLQLNQGITLQAYADEQPVLKGTEVVTGWTQQRNKLWRTEWKKLFPQKPADWWHRGSEGDKTPAHRFNNDMLFVDGRPLQSAGWEGELDENSYYIDYETAQVYLSFDPTEHVIEMTAHDSALVRVMGEVHGKKSDARGYTLRGLTFTQYAYRALEIEGREPEGLMDPATYGKDVVGTLIEHCTITHCSRVAGYFRGDRLTIRNSLVSDTSTEGIYVIGSSDCLLEKNIIARNNVEGITGYYPSAVKIFNQSHNVVCRDNLVIDHPDSSGIWYDVGNRDAVVVNNWFERCDNGFFFEISKGAICAGNVFVNCNSGTLALNSSGVRIYHNTYLNSAAAFRRDGRGMGADHFGWHPSTGPSATERVGHVFAGNLMVSDAGNKKSLLFVGQPQEHADVYTMPHLSYLDGNVYVRDASSVAKALIVWSPAAGETTQVDLPSLDALRKLQPAVEAHGVQLALPPSAVFHSPELKHFTLVDGFTTETVAETLPEEVRALVGWPKGAGLTPGAYQRPVAPELEPVARRSSKSAR